MNANDATDKFFSMLHSSRRIFCAPCAASWYVAVARNLMLRIV
jgi:hypothetical protein